MLSRVAFNLLPRKKLFFSLFATFLIIFLINFGGVFLINLLRRQKNSQSRKVFHRDSKKLTFQFTNDSEVFENNISKSLFNDVKTILFWYLPKGGGSPMILWYVQEDFSYLSLPKDWKTQGFEMDSPRCGRCRFTLDRKQLQSSDAVVFHARDISINDLPPPVERSSHQQYVWWVQESSSRLEYAGKNLSNYFNLTMSLRRTDDVFSPFGTFPWLLKLVWLKRFKKSLLISNTEAKNEHVMTDEELQRVFAQLPPSENVTIYSTIPEFLSTSIKELLRKKQRMAAWIASNCNWSTGAKMRFNYYQLLNSSGLKIDFFGKCAELTFPVKSRMDYGFFELLSSYKFYLAMENSFHCKDYLTEKLWLNSLYSGAVPVIFGPHPDDVAAVLPPKSYIHVEDFSDHHELIGYLQYLDRNVTAYAEYLQWRDLVDYLDENGNYNPGKTNFNVRINKSQRNVLKHYVENQSTGFCQLCTRLHKKDNKPTVVEDVNKMIHNDRPECFQPDFSKFQ